MPRELIPRVHVGPENAAEFSPGNKIGVRHDIALQGARVLAQPHGGIDNEKVRTLTGIPPEPLAYQNVCFQ